MHALGVICLAHVRLSFPVRFCGDERVRERSGGVFLEVEKGLLVRLCLLMRVKELSKRCHNLVVWEKSST